MVVSDKKKFLTRYGEFFRDCGYNVYSARCSFECAHSYFEGGVRIDLVVLDEVNLAAAWKLIELDEVIMDCLRKDPVDRPSSAEELAGRLTRCAVRAWTDEDAQSWWQLRLADEGTAAYQ